MPTKLVRPGRKYFPKIKNPVSLKARSALLRSLPSLSRFTRTWLSLKRALSLRSTSLRTRVQVLASTKMKTKKPSQVNLENIINSNQSQFRSQISQVCPAREVTKTRGRKRPIVSCKGNFQAFRTSSLKKLRGTSIRIFEPGQIVDFTIL